MREGGRGISCVVSTAVFGFVSLLVGERRSSVTVRLLAAAGSS